MIGQIHVPLRIILHNTYPEVQRRHVLIEIPIEKPEIFYGHINLPCEYWPPPLFTTKSLPVSIVILIHLVGPFHKFVEHLDDVGTFDGDTSLYLAGVPSNLWYRLNTMDSWGLGIYIDAFLTYRNRVILDIFRWSYISTWFLLVPFAVWDWTISGNTILFHRTSASIAKSLETF